MPTSLKNVAVLVGVGIPSGVIFPYGKSSAPSGWLLCDGSSYSTSNYSALFNVLGYKFGGSGSSFNVPNLQSRIPVGYNSGDSNFNSIGGSGGEAYHALSVNEMPPHGHGIQDPTHAHGVYDPGHSHYLQASANQFVQQGNTNQASMGDLGGFQSGANTSQSTTGVNLYGSGVGVGAAYNGSGWGHNNLMPYLTSQFIVKT